MEGRKKPEAVDKVRKGNRDEVTTSNVVAVGIIKLDALLPTGIKVEENIKAKSQGKKADAGHYETAELIAV